MSRQTKINACLVFVLAVVFYLFFQTCKQNPALSRMNVFTNDPYDTVGTAGTQFAAFMALLSMVRAFRPYQSDRDMDSRKVLFTRGASMMCLSVAVTLGADIVALVRYPAKWIGSAEGYTILALIGSMSLLTALMMWRIHQEARLSVVPSVRKKWVSPLSLSLVGIIILALYPESWHHNPIGELLTIILTTTLFFALACVWGMAFTPPQETGWDDAIDDLASIYRWLKVHIYQASKLLTPVEVILGSPLFRPIVDWLNPRKHPWNVIFLLGICVGLLIALTEAMSAGGIGSHFALLALIFAIIESAGILMGYTFLAKPLRLFRNSSDDNVKLKKSEESA